MPSAASSAFTLTASPDRARGDRRDHGHEARRPRAPRAARDRRARACPRARGPARAARARARRRGPTGRSRGRPAAVSPAASALFTDAREDHLDHLHGRRRGLAPAVHEARLDARAPSAADPPVVRRRARAPPGRRPRSHLGGQRPDEPRVLEGRPADLVDRPVRSSTPARSRPRTGCERAIHPA